MSEQVKTTPKKGGGPRGPRQTPETLGFVVVKVVGPGCRARFERRGLDWWHEYQRQVRAPR